MYYVAISYSFYSLFSSVVFATISIVLWLMLWRLKGGDLSSEKLSNRSIRYLSSMHKMFTTFISIEQSTTCDSRTYLNGITCQNYSKTRYFCLTWWDITLNDCFGARWSLYPGWTWHAAETQLWRIWFQVDSVLIVMKILYIVLAFSDVTRHTKKINTLIRIVKKQMHTNR